MNTSKLVCTIAIAGVMTLMTTSVIAKERTKGRGAMGAPVVYVTSQGEFYDSIVVTEYLPFNDTGNFQKLEVGPMGLQTEFGPGDTGYYGGRWWMDDGNGYMDEHDFYFLCPLLGPGRSDP